MRNYQQREEVNGLSIEEIGDLYLVRRKKDEVNLVLLLVNFV